MKRLPYLLLAAMLGVKLCSLFQVRTEKTVIDTVPKGRLAEVQEIGMPYVRLVLPADLDSAKPILLVRDPALLLGDPTLPNLKIRPEYLIEAAMQQ